MKNFLLIGGILVLLAPSAGAQQDRPRPRVPSITVTGEATISAEPNQAQIDIGVVTQARSAPEASKENAERLNRVLTNDPGLGVARHVDAGYEEAEKTARDKGVHVPMLKT